MDRYQEIVAEYAIRPFIFAGDTVHEVMRRVLDTLGAMCAAINGDAPRAARTYARLFPLPDGATVFGTPVRSTPEIAGFVNGVHARYLDFNDTYLSFEPLHPSDVILPLLALAERSRANGHELIEAIAIAYEISMNLCDAASLRAHGWDHVNYIGMATAGAAARLLHLDASRAAQAISLAIVPHAAMRQTRVGELSMWKGAAAANSARNGLFAALLAESGFTGPYEPFTGKMGVIAQMLGGEDFRGGRFAQMAQGEPPRRICDAYIKKYPVEYHAQSAVDAALSLHQETRRLEIESVEIETFSATYEIIVSDPEKWKPTTRETADHSLPYIVCAALLDGQVTQETFSTERLHDTRIAELLTRIKVVNSRQLTALYPDSIPVKIDVQTRGGGRFVREERYPRGHSRNKMSDTEVMAKFGQNCSGVLDGERAARLQDSVWGLEKAIDVRSVTRLWPEWD